MSSSRSPCKESVSSEEPWLLQLILPIRAFAQRLVRFRLWQLRSVSGQTACQSGQRFRSHYSFAQLRISHKLTCPRDRSLSSQCFGAAHTRVKIYGQRWAEAAGIETRHACPELIVYFWMAGIMSSCEKNARSGVIWIQGSWNWWPSLWKANPQQGNEWGHHPLKQTSLE